MFENLHLQSQKPTWLPFFVSKNSWVLIKISTRPMNLKYSDNFVISWNLWKSITARRNIKSHTPETTRRNLKTQENIYPRFLRRQRRILYKKGWKYTSMIRKLFAGRCTYIWERFLNPACYAIIVGNKTRL